MSDNNEVELKSLLIAALEKTIEDEKVGRVFHDFNNILSSSMGYANLALERAKTSEDEKLVRYLDNIERAGIRARDLVRESLDSRRQARNAVQTGFSECLKSVVPQCSYASSRVERVYYSEAHLVLLLKSLFSQYHGGEGAQCEAEVVEEFSCCGCNADLRGLQLKVSVSNVERKSLSEQDANDFLLAKALVNAQGGHVCESIMQDKQFVVYLRSVTSEDAQS